MNDTNRPSEWQDPLLMKSTRQIQSRAYPIARSFDSISFSDQIGPHLTFAFRI